MKEKASNIIEISECTRLDEIIEWLEEASRQDIVALATWIRNKTGIRVPASGTKDQLLFSLSKVPIKHLKTGIDVIFPDLEEDEYEEESDDDQSVDGDHADEDQEDESEEDEGAAESDDDDDEEEEPEPPKPKAHSSKLFRYRRG